MPLRGVMKDFIFHREKQRRLKAEPNVEIGGMKRTRLHQAAQPKIAICTWFEARES